MADRAFAMAVGLFCFMAGSRNELCHLKAAGACRSRGYGFAFPCCAGTSRLYRRIKLCYNS